MTHCNEAMTPAEIAFCKDAATQAIAELDWFLSGPDDEGALETLNDAHQALLRHGPFEQCADPVAYVRATNVLFDACLVAAMGYDEPDHEMWAAERIARWLVEV